MREGFGKYVARYRCAGCRKYLTYEHIRKSVGIAPCCGADSNDYTGCDVVKEIGRWYYHTVPKNGLLGLLGFAKEESHWVAKGELYPPPNLQIRTGMAPPKPTSLYKDPSV